VQVAGLGSAAVGQQGHREVPHEGRADRGLDAQVRDHSADDQLVGGEAAQQRFERGPLERVEADLVHREVVRAAAEFGHYLGVPGARLQAVQAGQRGAVLLQRPALVGAARPVQVPGEHHRDPSAPGLGHGQGGMLDGFGGIFQAHADPGERAFWVAEAVLHVHHEQRAVHRNLPVRPRNAAGVRRYGQTSSDGTSSSRAPAGR
jgi:hypothetical protein